MKKRMVISLLAAVALLSACNNGMEGGSSNTSLPDVPSNTTAAVQSSESEDDTLEIVAKLGVDYRENWSAYLMKFDEVLTCDYWFIKEGDTYHAFFLEVPRKGEFDVTQQNIGHAVSTDFLNWEYKGTVLKGYKADGKWPERQLTTGSVERAGRLRNLELYTDKQDRRTPPHSAFPPARMVTGGVCAQKRLFQLFKQRI